MRKEDGICLIVYAIMCAAALVVGTVVILPNVQSYAAFFPGGADLDVWWTLLFIVIGILVNVILIELGHIIGAKMGGYNVISVNMLGFNFYKTKGSWKFRFKMFDGLTGETRVAPKTDTSKPKPYAFMPFILYILVLVGSVIFYNIANSGEEYDSIKIASLLCIVISATGGIIQLYNIFPAKLDSSNDGYRLVIMSKPINVDAYNEMMRIEALQVVGEEIDNIKEFDEISDFTATVNLTSVNFLILKEKFEDAEKLVDKLLAQKEKVSTDTAGRVEAYKLFIRIYTSSLEDGKEFVKENINKEFKSFISNDKNLESIRAYALLVGVIEGSESELRFAIRKKEKAMKNIPVGKIKTEKELFELTLNKVYEVQPNWKR